MKAHGASITIHQKNVFFIKPATLSISITKQLTQKHYCFIQRTFKLNAMSRRTLFEI